MSPWVLWMVQVVCGVDGDGGLTQPLDIFSTETLPPVLP